MSSQARKTGNGVDNERSTFGIHFGDGSNMLEIEKEYKQVVFEMASNKGAPEEQRKKLLHVFREMDFTDAASEFLMDKFLCMRKTADELGIKLD